MTGRDPGEPLFGSRPSPAVMGLLNDALDAAVRHALEHVESLAPPRCLGVRRRGDADMEFSRLSPGLPEDVLLPMRLEDAAAAALVQAAGIGGEDVVVVTVYAPGVCVAMARGLDAPDDAWEPVRARAAGQARLDQRVMTLLALAAARVN